MIKLVKYLLLIILLPGYNLCNGQATNLIYNVLDYGATGKGKSNNQKAIQNAIDDCGKKGGTVVIPRGIYLTGQISLKSNITLQIDSLATLLGIQSDSEEYYPHHIIETLYPNRMKDDCQRRLIYGNHVQNVIIKGGGTINGQGDFSPWMHVKSLGTEKDRPSILAFVGSKNITVTTISMIKPACWTQVYIECDNVTISKIKVNTGEYTPNRDGLDIVDCHNVLIEDCQISSEDDGICFKSGSEYGCKDVIVRRCLIDKLNVQAGNCFKLGTDGLGSFTNFEVSELKLINAIQNSAFAIESMDGAVIDNLNISNCEISNCGQAIFIILADRRRTVPGRKTRIGALSNISFKNITGDKFSRQYPSIITGTKGHNIQNIAFENIIFAMKGGIQADDQKVMEYDGKYPEGSKFENTNAFGFFLRHVDQVTFTNCKISSDQKDARKWIVTEDVGQLNIK